MATAAVFSAPENTPPPLGVAEPVATTSALSRAEWLALRRGGIGGSDVAALCGLNPRRSRFEVWAEKTGLLESADVETPEMRWGHLLEPVVADEVEHVTPGLALFRVDQVLRHPALRYLLANVDRGAVLAGETGVYEGKTCNVFAGRAWEEGGLDEKALVQLMHYLLVTGLGYGVIGCLVAGQRLEVRIVERDETLIDRLEEIETEFWDHVVSGSPPAPGPSRAATDVLNRLWRAEPETVAVLDRAEIAGLLERRAHAMAVAEEAAGVRTEVENELRLRLGPAEVAVDDEGAQLYTWRAQTRRDIDRKALRRALYDVADELEVVSETRVLRVPKGAA